MIPAGRNKVTAAGKMKADTEKVPAFIFVYQDEMWYNIDKVYGRRTLAIGLLKGRQADETKNGKGNPRGIFP